MEGAGPQRRGGCEPWGGDSGGAAGPGPQPPLTLGSAGGLQCRGPFSEGTGHPESPGAQRHLLLLVLQVPTGGGQAGKSWELLLRRPFPLQNCIVLRVGPRC